MTFWTPGINTHFLCSVGITSSLTELRTSRQMRIGITRAKINVSFCKCANTFLEPKQEHVTTSYRSHKLHEDSESRVHQDTRSQKLELKKQNRLCLNTHICAWNFAHNLWKDLRTHFHFCLLSFLVAPFVHRATCASWPRGLGISRTRLDTSNSLSKGQHLRHFVSDRCSQDPAPSRTVQHPCS